MTRITSAHTPGPDFGGDPQTGQATGPHGRMPPLPPNGPGCRSQDTASSPLVQRRMDSLARLLHSHMPDRYDNEDFKNPVATAVGIAQYDNGQTAVAIAHNHSGPSQQAVDADRLACVQATLTHGAPAADVARYLEGTSGLGHGTGQQRLERDLAKLQRTYEGRDSGRPGADQLQGQLHAIFNQPSAPHYDYTMTDPASGPGTVHAESALLAANVPGHIGVSKLSCGDCADYAAELGRPNDVRGTHGQRFPGWMHPGDGTIHRTRDISRENQYPSDSDSDG